MSGSPYTEAERAARREAKKKRTYHRAIETACSRFASHSDSYPWTAKQLGGLRTDAHNLYRLIHESMEPDDHSRYPHFGTCMEKLKNYSKEEMMSQGRLDCHTVATLTSQDDPNKVDLLDAVLRLRENLHSRTMSSVLLNTLKSANEIRTSVCRPGGLASYTTSGRVRREALRSDINDIRRSLLMYLGASQRGGTDERGNITPLPVCDQRITEIDFSKCQIGAEKWGAWVKDLNRVIETCDSSDCSAVMRNESPSLAMGMVKVLVDLGCRTEPWTCAAKSVT